MPGDLAVHAASHPSALPPAVTPAEAGQPAGPSPAASAAVTASASAAAVQSPAGVAVASGGSASGESGGVSVPSLHTNPVSQLDPALGIVVLSFYNEKGVETSSIPTQKQLESYRLHGDAPAAASARSPASSDT